MGQDGFVSIQITVRTQPHSNDCKSYGVFDNAFKATPPLQWDWGMLGSVDFYCPSGCNDKMSEAMNDFDDPNQLDAMPSRQDLLDGFLGDSAPSEAALQRGYRGLVSRLIKLFRPLLVGAKVKYRAKTAAVGVHCTICVSIILYSATEMVDRGNMLCSSTYKTSLRGMVGFSSKRCKYQLWGSGIPPCTRKPAPRELMAVER